MTDEEKLKRLKELQEKAATYTEAPHGLVMQITKLRTELGLIKSCDLDGDCLNCGS